MITAIILTKNEGRHLERCLRSLKGVASRVVVVDCFSSDDTEAVARANGAEFVQNAWVNYATQFQFGIDYAKAQTPWTMRIDADEYLTAELRAEILRRLPNLSDDVTGVYVPRKIVFLGDPVQRGFFYPMHMLRIWRSGVGRIEQRWMDEHIVLAHGTTVQLKGDLIDENLNDVTWWIDKHNGYATREMIDLASIKYGFGLGDSALAAQGGSAARLKRFLKEKVYAKLPAGLRVELYFTWRFWIGAGFLEKPGARYFHVMQARWYRALVDMKLFEIEREARLNGVSVREAIERKYRIKIA